MRTRIQAVCADRFDFLATFLATSAALADAPGRIVTRDVELHVDRTPPTVGLYGDILDVDRGWQDPDQPVTARQGQGHLSGLTAVELWLRDANGPGMR